jgi:hypothetical protein
MPFNLSFFVYIKTNYTEYAIIAKIQIDSIRNIINGFLTQQLLSKLLDKDKTLCLPNEFSILEIKLLRNVTHNNLHHSIHIKLIENNYLPILLADNHHKMFLEEVTSWPVIMIASPSNAKLTTPHTMH